MRIADAELRQSISQVLGDPEALKILHSVRDTPRNAQEISKESGVPLSSAYRKLGDLKAAGLVFVKSIEITPEGKRQDLFLSAVAEVRIDLTGGEVEFDLVPTREGGERIWFRLFGKQ